MNYHVDNFHAANIILIGYKQSSKASYLSWSPFYDNSSPLMLQICIKELGYHWFIWFNSLWPSDTIWRLKSGSTLAQVMVLSLTAPSHYLNQCWLIISKVQWHSSGCNFTRYLSHQSLKLVWKLLKFCSKPPGANELIMACRQIDTQPLSKPILTSYQLHLKDRLQWNDY